MVNVAFTNDGDQSEHVAALPPHALTAAVEALLLTAARSAGEGQELRARVEPAVVRGRHEVIAFAVIGEEDDQLLGRIPCDCALVSGAVSDLWERHLTRTGRPLTETATYSLVRANGAAHRRQGEGIRVVGGGALRYSLRVPAVRALDLSRAVSIGKTGEGLCERVFGADAFQALREFFLADMERERMGVLHGDLWWVVDPEGNLVPCVIYEDFVPLSGEGTASSIHVAPEAQLGSTGHPLPLAGLVHSHPALRGNGDGGEGQATEDGYGTSSPSATDLAQLRRALPHVHQASIVVALPSDPDKPLRLAPYGYGPGGTIQGEPGFWIANLS